MYLSQVFSKRLVIIGIVGALSGCSEPRAVMLPLEYPDGTPVTTTNGEPAMAGYQTYGSSTHARATALYEQARPPSCATCARVGAVVTEPSVLRQATGVLGTAAIGTGAVMTGIGVMDYGAAARENKLGTNISQNNSNTNKNANTNFNANANSNFNSNTNNNYKKTPPRNFDHDHDRRHDRRFSNNMGNEYQNPSEMQDGYRNQGDNSIYDSYGYSQSFEAR